MDFEHATLIINSKLFNNFNKFTFDNYFEAHGGAFGWGTAQLRFPKLSLEFVIDLMLSAALREISINNKNCTY